MNILETSKALGCLMLVGLLAAGCASSRDKPRMRVTEERGYIRLNHVQNTPQTMSLKKGDAVAMVCAKCKTVLYANVDRPRNRFFVPLEHRHYCPGCKSTITVTGAGFNLKEQVEHTCSVCGSNSVFCCATTTDAPPTEGMERK